MFVPVLRSFVLLAPLAGAAAAETQKNQACCGVASMVMVFDAIERRAPAPGPTGP